MGPGARETATAPASGDGGTEPPAREVALGGDAGADLEYRRTGYRSRCITTVAPSSLSVTPENGALAGGKNVDPILFWNEVVNEADRTTHTTGAPSEVRSQGPCGSSRAYSIVHLAMHDAYFSINPGKYDTYVAERK